MISSLLREVESLGCAVTCEGDKLKLDNPSVLAPAHKEQLKKHKSEIMDFFKQQERARALGWLVYPYGEAYEKQVGRYSWVYLFQERNGQYTAWRGTWRDKQTPDKEKIIIEHVDLKMAFDKAISYVKWFSKGR